MHRRVVNPVENGLTPSLSFPMEYQKKLARLMGISLVKIRYEIETKLA